MLGILGHVNLQSACPSPNTDACARLVAHKTCSDKTAFSLFSRVCSDFFSVVADPAVRPLLTFNQFSLALTSVAQWVGRHHLAKQKVAGSIPGQGPSLGYQFGPWLRGI